MFPYTLGWCHYIQLNIVDIDVICHFYHCIIFLSVCLSLHLRYALGFTLEMLIVSNLLFVHSPLALLFVYAGPVLPCTTCTNNYVR